MALTKRRNRCLISLALISVGLAIIFREPVVVLIAAALIIAYFFPRRAKAKVRLTIKNHLTDFVHSKIYVIDSKAMISSANLTYSGLNRNYETLVIFEKGSIVDSIAKTYEELEG